MGIGVLRVSGNSRFVRFGQDAKRVRRARTRQQVLATLLAGTGFLLLSARGAPPPGPELKLAELRPGATREMAPAATPLSRIAGTGAAPSANQGITAPAQTDPPACPDDMVLVHGQYCSQVEHTCRKWLDDPTLSYARCAEYEPTARCTGTKSPLSYCIDRYEYTEPGADLPKNHASLMKANKICKDLGKRLCSEAEWNFACEGEEMRPYPYGWSRAAKCNQDQSDLYVYRGDKVQLKDRRTAAGANPECVSPFGVYDMAGNLDEPVLRDAAQSTYPFRTALKGGWWMAARNRCRPATTAHDDYYEDVQVGVRCCKDSGPAVSTPGG